MKQQLLRRVSVSGGECLSYYLLESSETLDSGDACLGYGIRIQEDKHLMDAVLPGISTCRDYTLNLLYQLADCVVYPVHLLDIVTEIIG